MTTLSITAGPYTFRARLEEERAPKTCETFSKLLPFEQKVIHVRWSGESTWIPLGDSTSALASRTTPAIPRPARSSSTPAATARRRSCCPTGAAGSRASSVSSPATTSLPWLRATRTSARWAR